MVDNASTIARLTNRVIMVAKQETDNSEDPHFVHRVTSASNILESSNIIIFNQSFLMINNFFCFSSCTTDGSSC